MYAIKRSQDEFAPEPFEFTEAAEEYDGSRESPFDEAEEMEWAARLLEITDEAELEYFLEELMDERGRRKRRGGRQAAPDGQEPQGGQDDQPRQRRRKRSLGKMLKRVIKTAAPIAGTAFGGPIGGALGSQVASQAGELFGLELEGLSPEDQEFEVARQFARFAGAAADNLAPLPPALAPEIAARTAVIRAARVHAPGLLRVFSAPAFSSFNPASAQNGRWIRRGFTIILHGI